MSNQKFGKIKEELGKIKPILKKKFQVKNIGIFGSYVKGEESSESDLDILVEFKEDSDLSLLDFVNLENYLSDVLEVKVDLVEKQTLKPHIGEHILREVTEI